MSGRGWRGRTPVTARREGRVGGRRLSRGEQERGGTFRYLCSTPGGLDAYIVAPGRLRHPRTLQPVRGQTPPDLQQAQHSSAELTWRGQKEVEGEYQRAVNCMGRSTLGAFQSTPQGIVAGEWPYVCQGATKPPPAKFTQRHYARPRDSNGLKEILTRERPTLTMYL